jgi:hypothetical protein
MFKVEHGVLPVGVFLVRRSRQRHGFCQSAEFTVPIADQGVHLVVKIARQLDFRIEFLVTTLHSGQVELNNLAGVAQDHVARDAVDLRFAHDSWGHAGHIYSVDIIPEIFL